MRRLEQEGQKPRRLQLKGSRISFLQLSHAPLHDEVEVSVFGPGYGEGIAIHTGNHDWIVVDSCIEPGAQLPAVLQYFNALDIDPSTAVKLVIATHWHDDHIRGLGKNLSACDNATFVCSSALRTSEFMTLVKAYGTRPMDDYSGIQAFSDIIAGLETRAQRSGRKPLSPTWAIANRIRVPLRGPRALAFRYFLTVSPDGDCQTHTGT